MSTVINNFNILYQRDFIKKEMTEMLSQLCTEQGLSFQLSKMTYSPDTLKIVVDLAVPDTGAVENTSANDPYLIYRNSWKKNWRRYESYGLKNEWLGKKFKYGLTEYTVVGITPRKCKYMVFCSADHWERRWSIGKISKFLL